MIDPNILTKINDTLKNEFATRHVIGQISDPRYSVTIGLIRAEPSRDASIDINATWLHRTYPHIERQLARHAVKLLKAEHAKTMRWLEHRNVN